MDFAKYASKGNEIINKISSQATIPENKAGRILRASLHALRNRISIDESFHLLAQLPLVLKGIYVDGWRPNQPFERIKHMQDFLDEVRAMDTGNAAYDFGNDEKAKQLIGVVFQVMQEYISEGEFEDVLGHLPPEIRSFMQMQKKEQPTIL
jgi:uncharacterized protein (DUF2267 family)